MFLDEKLSLHVKKGFVLLAFLSINLEVVDFLVFFFLAYNLTMFTVSYKSLAV